MHYALVPIVGTGTEVDPFRAPTDQPHSVIDLRPSPTLGLGWMLLATPARETTLTGLYLGDDVRTVSPAMARGLESRLGITLRSAPTLSEVLAEILTQHAREDGTRWKPLHPHRVRSVETGDRVDRWEVFLGEQLVYSRDVPVLAGAESFTESFNKADSSTLGPLQTWVEQRGSWSVSTNRATVAHDSTSGAVAYADHALDSPNHYAQAVVTAGSSEAGVVLRQASGSTQTSYVVDYQFNGEMRLLKRVLGAYTILVEQSLTATAFPVTLRGEVNGSTLSSYVNGAARQSVTDTSVTDGTLVGLYVQRDVNATPTFFDSFAAGDLQTALDLGGTTAPTGAVVKRVPKVFTAAATPSGESLLQRIVLRVFTAALAPTGALLQVPVKILSGTTAPAGALSRVWNKVLTGSVNPAGAFRRAAVKLLGGDLGVTGDFEGRMLGRIFGQAGHVAVLVRAAGEVLVRVRRR